MGARRTTGAGVAVLAVLLLGGCGSGDDKAADDASSPSQDTSATTSAAATSAAPRPTTTPAPAGTAECTEVWRKGATLPKAYRGCAADGLLVAPDPLGCSSGQTLIRYDDRFWAVRGGPISGGEGSLMDSPDYQKVVSTCRG